MTLELCQQVIMLHSEIVGKDAIGMTRDDSLTEPTKEKAHRLGLTDGPVPYEDQAVENVAMVELLKA